MSKYKLILDDRQTAVITIRNKRENRVITALNWDIEKLNELNETDSMKQYYRNNIQSIIDVLYTMDIINEPITALATDNAKLTALYE